MVYKSNMCFSVENKAFNNVYLLRLRLRAWSQSRADHPSLCLSLLFWFALMHSVSLPARHAFSELSLALRLQMLHEKHLPSHTHSHSHFCESLETECWKFWLLLMNNINERLRKFSPPQLSSNLMSTPVKAKRYYLLHVYIIKSNHVPHCAVQSSKPMIPNSTGMMY